LRISLAISSSVVAGLAHRAGDVVGAGVVAGQPRGPVAVVAVTDLLEDLGVTQQVLQRHVLGELRGRVLAMVVTVIVTVIVTVRRAVPVPVRPVVVGRREPRRPPVPDSAPHPRAPVWTET
jgi:hypothetical protein